MTGIDVLVSMFLTFCVSHEPKPLKERGTPYTVTVYDCPLIKSEGAFLVWRHQCPNAEEQHTVAVMDWKTGQGVGLNEFGGLDVAYLATTDLAVYWPKCELEGR